MGHKEIIDLLDQLENKRGLPYVAVIIPPARVWVKKYAWFAEGPAPAEPKESPSCSDQFFLAVRNLSVRRLSVEFECESRHGRVRFDKSSTNEFKFSETIVAVPQRLSGSVAIVKNTHIEIVDEGEASDVIEITAQTLEHFPAEQRRLLGNPETESIILYFP